jgi:hypothetical protein
MVMVFAIIVMCLVEWVDALYLIIWIGAVAFAIFGRRFGGCF